MPGVVNLEGIDKTIVATETLKLLNTPDDFSNDFRNDFAAPLNNQKTTQVEVRLKPVAVLADMPDAATRDGLLPRTSVSSGTVLVNLSADKYFKLAVDDQGVEPEQTSREIGEAGGLAIVKYSNSNLLAGLSGAAVATGAGKNTVALGATSSAATGDQVWNSLVDAVTELGDADYTEDFVLYIARTQWAKLIKGEGTLKSVKNPQEEATSLLGVSKVRLVNLPGANDVAVVAHRGSVVVARILSGIREAQEDFDSIVEGRIKIGTNVLDKGAIRVIRATA